MIEASDAFKRKLADPDAVIVFLLRIELDDELWALTDAARPVTIDVPGRHGGLVTTEFSPMAGAIAQFALRSQGGRGRDLRTIVLEDPQELWYQRLGDSYPRCYGIAYSAFEDGDGWTEALISYSGEGVDGRSVFGAGGLQFALTLGGELRTIDGEHEVVTTHESQLTRSSADLSHLFAGKLRQESWGSRTSAGARNVFPFVAGRTAWHVSKTGGNGVSATAPARNVNLNSVISGGNLKFSPDAARVVVPEVTATSDGSRRETTVRSIYTFTATNTLGSITVTLSNTAHVTDTSVDD